MKEATVSKNFWYQVEQGLERVAAFVGTCRDLVRDARTPRIVLGGNVGEVLKTLHPVSLGRLSVVSSVELRRVSVVALAEIARLRRGLVEVASMGEGSFSRQSVRAREIVLDAPPEDDFAGRTTATARSS